MLSLLIEEKQKKRQPCWSQDLWGVVLPMLTGITKEVS